MALRLSASELTELGDVMRDAFDRDMFELFLARRLDKRIENYAGPGNYPIVMFRVLDGANREGWIGPLIAAALDSRPSDVALQTFASSVGVGAPIEHEGATVSGDDLEAIVSADAPMVHVEEWMRRLGEHLPRVCRVEIRGTAKGTGFLVGRDVVMTNRHVLASVLDGATAAADVQFRFGYRTGPDGVAVSAGETFGLADDWNLDSLPHAARDVDENAPDPPSPEELDFALVRLAEAIGDAPIGANAEPGAPARGWVRVAPEPSTLTTGQAAVILQHPSGDPLKITIGAAQELNENATRQRYSANTLPGSSGSPVFNMALEVCLLHHAGDPSYVDFAAFNQGVPMGRIAERIRGQGLGDTLGN